MIITVFYLVVNNSAGKKVASTKKETALFRKRKMPSHPTVKHFKAETFKINKEFYT